MTDFTPGKTVTLTIASTPRRAAERKTIERLMRMQPKVRKGLKTLQAERARSLNYQRPRAGRLWTVRASATRIIRADVGASFTVRVTPQIVADLKSVSKYLTA